MIGFGIVIPVLPLYAEGGSFHASPMQLGWLLGIFSLTQLIATPIIGKISDRLGRKPVLMVSVFCTSIGFVLMGAATALWMLFLARIIAGVSGGNIATAQACVADLTPADQRSKSMGLMGAAFGLGFVLGPALGGILNVHVSPSAPFYFAAGLALCNFIFIAFCLPETLPVDKRAHAGEKTSLSEVFADKKGVLLGTILAAYLASITGFTMMTALFALYNQKRLHFGANHTGYFLTYVGVLGILIQGGLLRRLLNKPIEKPLAAGGSFLLAIGLVLLPFCTGALSLIWVLVLIALGNGFVVPTLNGLASRCSSSQVQGRMTGLMQSAGSLGRFVGPLLAMPLSQLDIPAHYGLAPFWGGAVCSLIACFLVLTLSKDKIKLTS